jgi:hypothetical protein
VLRRPYTQLLPVLDHTTGMMPPKIAYDAKYGSSRIDCARKMSSILGQNCPEFMVATFPIQVTDISFPLAPSLHTSLLTSFPHSFAYFCHPSFSLSYKGRMYHISHLPRKQSASTPNQRRFVTSRSVRGFAVVCVF